MTDDPGRLAAILAGGRLGGREVRVLPVPASRSGEQVLLVPLLGTPVREAWAAGRAVLGRTGRWPVAVVSWADDGALDEWVLSRGSNRVDPATLCAEADGLDPAGVLAGLDLPPEEEDGPAGDEHLAWFDPEALDHRAYLAFLPSPRPQDALAYVPFFGEETPGVTAPGLVALCAGWHARFGAEPVAHWGTMLQFAVTRPPGTLEEALGLAREQVAIAPCTTLLSGVSLRDHARALLGRAEWFLHERP